MAASSLRVVSMSRTCGMFLRMTGSSVSRAAAIAGKAAFLAPLARMVPSSGDPPRITNLSMLNRFPGTTSRIASPMGHVLSAALSYCNGEVSGRFEVPVNRKGTTGWNEISPQRGPRKIVAAGRLKSESGCPLQRTCRSDGLASVAACKAKSTNRSLARNSSFQHDQGKRDASGRFEGAFGGSAIDAGSCLQDGNSTLQQFFVLQVDIHHEVVVDVAKPGHGPGGKYIQNHFLSRTSFHSAGSGDDLGTNFGDN